MELTVPVPGGVVSACDSGGGLPPLVLLHPGVGDSTIWEPLLPLLAPHHRVIRYDVRGYGHSPRPTGPYSLLADLTAVLDHFELRRVPLVGCSMGGGAALSLALAAPARVASLVLLRPGIPDHPWPPEPELDAEYDELVAAGDHAGLTAYGLREWAAAGSDPAAVAQLASAARAWPGEDVHQVADPPVLDRLGELAVPSTLLVGDLDRQPVIACGRAVAARIPGCRLRLVPGADHLLPLRAPEATAAAITATVG